MGGLISSSYHSNVNGTPVKDHFLPSYDANGNIIAWSDGGGTMLQRRDYDPFGKPVMIESFGSASLVTKIPDHGFSTKPQDAETGLYYYGYRYYDPVTGRWPSRDPIEENGGLNSCGFLYNYSFTYIDILGQNPLPPGVSPMPQGWLPPVNSPPNGGGGGISPCATTCTNANLGKVRFTRTRPVYVLVEQL